MADFDKSTFDPKAAAEARKKEMDQMAEKLEAGVKDVFQGENYKASVTTESALSVEPFVNACDQLFAKLKKQDETSDGRLIESFAFKLMQYNTLKYAPKQKMFQ